MAASLVQSVLRAVDLLEAAAAAESGLALAELAEALGVAVPTAHNLAKTLASRGYLERSSRPVRYRLGGALLDLAERQMRRVWLSRAEGVVRGLFQDLGVATVLLAEDAAGDFLPRLRMDPSRPDVLERVVNRHLSPYASAVALCFQAFWPEAEAAAFRDRHPFSEYGQGLWRDLAHLQEFLASVRRAGHVGLQDSGSPRVAFPVTLQGGVFAGCLGASLNAPDLAKARGLTFGRLVEAVGAAAARLSGPVAAPGKRPASAGGAKGPAERGVAPSIEPGTGAGWEAARRAADLESHVPGASARRHHEGVQTP